MRIYVVIEGESQEASTNLSAHVSRGRALKAAEGAARNYNCGRKMSQVSETRWEGGCDYIEVEEMELDTED